MGHSLGMSGITSNHSYIMDTLAAVPVGILVAHYSSSSYEQFLGNISYHGIDVGKDANWGLIEVWSVNLICIPLRLLV